MTASTPVVLVHGWGASASTWDPVVAELRALGVDRISTVALPGSPDDRSDDPPTIRSAADRVLGALREWDEPALLVGHSMGGQVTMLCNAEAPHLVVCEIVIDPAYGAAGTERPAMEAWADRIDAEGHAAVSAFFDDAARELPPPALAAVMTALGRTSAATLAGYLRSEYVASDAIGLLPASASASARRRAPVLTICSSEAGEARENALPRPAGSVVERWDGHGHFLHLQDPRRFAATLAHALNGNDAPLAR